MQGNPFKTLKIVDKSPVLLITMKQMLLKSLLYKLIRKGVFGSIENKELYSPGKTWKY